jgi:sortase A
MSLKVYTKKFDSKRRKAVRMLSYVVLFAGMGMLFWAYYPMISFEIYARFFIRKEPSSPLADRSTASSIELAQSVEASSGYFSDNLRDFTQANLWFRVKNFPSGKTIDIKEYTLSIPSLSLQDLRVDVGGDDLSKSLIHYLPTSKPGQYGKVAIFGHSTLPQLYDEKDYKTVFTYLPKMNIGDEVIVTVEGKKYEYEVFDMYIVQPDKVSVLEQNFNASYLMLITCVPPGTYKERLIVEAKLK